MCSRLSQTIKINDKYGKFTVIGYDGTYKDLKRKTHRMWVLQCGFCPQTIRVREDRLNDYRHKSGCMYCKKEE